MCTFGGPCQCLITSDELKRCVRLSLKVSGSVSIKVKFLGGVLASGCMSAMGFIVYWVLLTHDQGCREGMV